MKTLDSLVWSRSEKKNGAWEPNIDLNLLIMLSNSTNCWNHLCTKMLKAVDRQKKSLLENCNHLKFLKRLHRFHFTVLCFVLLWGVFVFVFLVWNRKKVIQKKQMPLTWWWLHASLVVSMLPLRYIEFDCEREMHTAVFRHIRCTSSEPM